MAYTATVSSEERRISGRRYLIVTVTETEAAAASEYEVTGWPFPIATLVSFKATLTAGTGTTINPSMGKSTGWTANTQDHIGTQTTTAAHIDDDSHVTFHNGSKSLYVKSGVDAGADNSISTVIVFAEGQV